MGSKPGRNGGKRGNSLRTMKLLNYDEFGKDRVGSAAAAKKLAMTLRPLARIDSFARKNDFRG
jgi:hypothetical protein